MTDDPFDDATPNCDQCLAPLEIAGDERRAWWVCPSCGLVRL